MVVGYSVAPLERLQHQVLLGSYVLALLEREREDAMRSPVVLELPAAGR